MYVETIKSKRTGKSYKSVLVRESYREDGKVMHRTLANVSKLPASVVEQLKQALSGNGSVPLDDIQTSASREYGGSFALLELSRMIGLDTILYSRKQPWREDALAMIVGRVLWQGSKLSLINLFRDTALWELCGHARDQRPDVEKSCYRVMDRLLARQPAIQRTLAERHLDDGCLILYDITNTWLEGEYAESELAAFGMGKGGKKGFKQIAVGLVANRHGCPVAVEVFRGNTADQSTVWDQACRLSHQYGVKEVVFAGDRGMLTPKRIEEVTSLGFRALTALTHPQMNALVDKKVIHPELFDERNIVEVVDPDTPNVRHMLCKNPDTMKKERQTRLSLVEAVSSRLDDIAKVVKKRDPQRVCARVGAVLAKYRIAKFFEWSVDKKGKLEYQIRQDAIEAEAALDGCCVVRTDAAAESVTKNEAVSGYMALTHVEKAFRNLKTVALELSPVYHKTDDRIRAHVFVCLLAYYLLWHMQQKLKPLLENDGTGADRRWTMETVVERLKSLREETMLLCGVPVKTIRNVPDVEQRHILNLLGVEWS